MTGAATWEWDGPNAVLLSGGDVARKPGATAVSVLTEGKLALTMTDGKVTGWIATGKGHWPVDGWEVIHLHVKAHCPWTMGN